MLFRSDGNRALFGARGDVFTVPAKYGNTRNLTQTPGVHERNSKWSPDGKWIAFISDASGEDEIWIQAQDGNSDAKRITTNGDNYKYQIAWSPDSKKIMWADRKQKLYFVDVESKSITEVAHSEQFEFSDYTWSPDSKWISYAKPEVDVLTKIYLYSLESKETNEVTDGWFSSSEPSFSSDGKYLFFVSDRSFNPISSNTEFNYAYFDMQKIYFVTLAKDTKSPFEPKSDEVKIKSDESKKDDKSDDKKKDEKKGDDDLDLFGDETEEQAAAAKAAVDAAKSKKKEKKPVIAQSLVLFEVKPYDSETNLDDLAKAILAIEGDGIYWKTEYKKEPVAFGIYKLVIGVTVEDEKVSVDSLQEKIEELKNSNPEPEPMVQSVEILAFNKI